MLLRRSVDRRCIVQGMRRSGTELFLRFEIDFGSDYTDAAWCMALHPTEQILATGHWDNMIRIWDISLSTPNQLVEWKAHRGHVCDIEFSTDGTQIVSGGWDSKTKVWTSLDSFRSKPSSEQTISVHKDVVRSVAYSPNGRFVASGGEDGQILLWDRTNPMSLMHPEDPAPQRNLKTPATPNSLQFNKAGTWLLSSDNRGRVTVWSVATGKIVKRWQLAGWVNAAKFSPDESMIATGNSDGTVFLLRAPKASE